MNIYEDLNLNDKTDPRWVDIVLSDFDTFLKDHADCERKASATAMAFIRKFPDKKQLIEPMIALAREELAHFHEVVLILYKRDQVLDAGSFDIYTKSLRSLVRHPRDEYFLDLLLISGIIEARACERLELLGPHIPDESLKSYYLKLAKIEAGHFRIFSKTAEKYFDKKVIYDRLKELLVAESEVFRKLPLTATIH